MSVKLPEASLKFSAHITATDCIGTRIRVKMEFNSILYICSIFFPAIIHSLLYFKCTFHSVICSNETTTEKTLSFHTPQNPKILERINKQWTIASSALN